MKGVGTASKELINMMTDFLISEIGSKSIDGITYTMVLKRPQDKEEYDRYMRIRREAQNCGFGPEDAFRVYEVSNGYIFDMDMSVAKKITYELSKAVNKTNGGRTPIADFIGDKPEQRRKQDMLGLAKFVKSEFDKGKREIEVALFNRNSTPRIIVTAIGPDNSMIVIKYNAYAIRHWDIETVNAALLIPAGIRISTIEPCEIIPSKRGVRFKMYLEPLTGNTIY